MKVFNISPHRSGTRSFHSFCCAHGLRSKHWCGAEMESAVQSAFGRYRNLADMALRPVVLAPHFDAYYATGDVFSDFPTPLLYPTFLGAADHKYVIVTRDAAAWVRSARRLKHSKPLTFLERAFYFELTGRLVTSLAELSDEQLTLGYGYYLGRAYRDMETNGEKRLVVSLTDPDIGAKIAAFIGFEQLYPFPTEGDV